MRLPIILESGGKLPIKATKLSAGYDLFANEAWSIHPHERRLIPTGVRMQIAENYYGQIASRSSLALRGIDVGAGVIDADYTGEIKVLLINNGSEVFRVLTGDKIAQIIILPFKRVVPMCGYKILQKTERGDMGFGSTG